MLFPAPRGVLLSGCLRSDYLPFGPRGSTVSGRHVYGRAIGAGDFSIRRFLLKPRLRGALRLIADLMGLTPPVKISLILPEYLATGPQRNLAGREEPVGSNRWNLASRTDEAQRALTETL